MRIPPRVRREEEEIKLYTILVVPMASMLSGVVSLRDLPDNDHRIQTQWRQGGLAKRKIFA